MARNGSPSTNPSPSPGSPQAAPPPPPPSSGPAGPTGTSGFSMGETAIDTLRKAALDLESRYRGVSTQLTAQKLAVNALGMFGIPMAVAVNGSNSNSVAKANQASETMGKVNDALRATAETHTNTDQFIADQFGKIVPDSGAKNPQGSPGVAPRTPTPAGPEVAPVEEVPGGPSTAPPATPAPIGPQVSTVDQVPGGPATAPPAAQTPGGPQVSSVDPIPGGPTTAPPSASPTPAGPQVTPVTPVPGSADVTSTAAAQPPTAPPVAPPPTVPGAPNPNGTTAPGGPPVTLVPPVPGGPKAPRPGVVPNVPGVNGPPKGTFSPLPPAKDALGPIAAANPTSPPPPTAPPKPPVTGPGLLDPRGYPGGQNLPGQPGPKATPAPPLPTGGGPTMPSGDPAPPVKPPLGLLDPKGYPGGDNLPGQPGPKGEAAPPVVTGAPAPPGPPTPPPIAPVKAPPNILDLLDPRGYPGGENLPGQDGPKADGAWPATTIDGKPWADLSSLTPEQSQKWIDNLRNILHTKPDGAFFWSGSVYDSDGNRVSVMDEAGEIAHANGRNTLEGLLDDKGVKLPGWGNTSPEGKAVWDSVSASLAHGSSGDVYVLLGPSRRPENVFHMTEFPILEQNPNVGRVIAVDVLTKQETVIIDKKR